MESQNPLGVTYCAHHVIEQRYVRIIREQYYKKRDMIQVYGNVAMCITVLVYLAPVHHSADAGDRYEWRNGDDRCEHCYLSVIKKK